MLPGPAIASPLVAAVFAAVFPPVSVAVAPGLACPTVDAVDRAIAGVRGGAPPAAGPTYRLRIWPSGDLVRAELIDVAGGLVWARAFVAGAAACSSGPDAIALIVEREFREIAWTPPPATDRDAPNPLTAVSTAPAAPATMATAASAPAIGAPPLAASVPLLAASVGPALWSRADTLALAIDARLRLRGPWQVGLGVLVPPANRSVGIYATAAGEGNAPEAKVTSIPVIAALGLEQPLAHRLSGHVAVETLVSFERGESVGIAAPATAWRTVLAAGAAAGGVVALGDRLRLEVRAGLYRTLLGRSYMIDGVSGSVLEPPAWQAMLRLGLGWAFLP